MQINKTISKEWGKNRMAEDGLNSDLKTHLLEKEKSIKFYKESSTSKNE